MKKQIDLIPDDLLDSKGYPTNNWLRFIKRYKPDHTLPIMKFVELLTEEGWYGYGYGFKISKGKGKMKLELHTGGWSGNEEIIQALLTNFNLTVYPMKYVMWKTGGYYYFEIKTKLENKH